MDSRIAGITFYTEQDIRNWASDLKHLPQQLQSNLSIILASNKEIDGLQPILAGLNAEIAPINKKIKALQARIEIIISHNFLKEAEAKIPTHSESAASLMPKLNDLEVQLADRNVAAQRNAHHIKIKILQTAINGLETQIQSASSDLENRQAQLKELEAKIAVNLLELSRIDAMQQHADHVVPHYPHQSQPQYPAPMGLVYVIRPAVSYPHAYDVSADYLHQRELLKQAKAQLQSEKSFITFKIQRESETLRDLNAQRETKAYELASFPVSDQGVARATQLYELRNKEKTIAAQQKNLSSVYDPIQAEYARHIAIASKARKTVAELLERIDLLTPVAEEFANESNLAELKRLCHAKVAKKNPLELNNQKVVAQLAAQQLTIDTARAENSKLEARLSALQGNEFLIQLRDHPFSLVESLAKAVREHFALYEKTHPAQQSNAVRVCLAEFNDKIEVIQNSKIKDQPGMVDNDRSKIYELSGLLWHMYDYLVKSGDTHLAEEIVSCFDNTGLDRQESLTAFRARSGLAPDTSTFMLEEFEKIAYETAFKLAEDEINKLAVKGIGFNDQYVKGNAVLNAIRTHKQHSREAQFDIKFYTTILNETAKLAEPSSNRESQMYYKFLAKQEPAGKSSLTKKIGGVMLMFLGAAIIAASVCVEVLSINAAMPLARSGLGVGSALVLSGAGLFASGRIKGLSKALTEYGDAAEKVGRPSRAKPGLADSNMTGEDDSPMRPAPSAPYVFGH